MAGLCIFLQCSTWTKIGLHLNLIICTCWSCSTENIHVIFHLIETIWIVKRLFRWKFLHKFLHLLTSVKVVVPLLHNIIWSMIQWITFTNNLYWWDHLCMGCSLTSKSYRHRKDKNVMKIVVQNSYLTSNRIAAEVNFFGNTPADSKTVPHWLCKCGLCDCKPVQTLISLWNTNDNTCLSLEAMRIGVKEIGGGSSS